MHELSIAYNLVSIAEDAAKEAGVDQIDSVHLKLGALAGVVQDALLFSFDVATKGTLLEGSTLQIENVPVVIYCEQCDAEHPLENIQLLRCPVCDTPCGDIRQGKELELVYLEYSEHETAHS